jgi:hypothetical protein
MSDFSLQCAFRRNKQRTNIPLARFTPVSPYTNPITGLSTGLTQQALDMRRKAEILKYESNRMSTQTNNLTKNQRWSRLANASGKSARLLDPTTVVCPGETAVRRPNPVPTSSSGVPGPVMYLYEDPDVPLYNYIVTRTYAFDVPNIDSYWNTTVYSNVGIYSQTPENVFSLSIKQNINTDQVFYTLNVPVSIHCEGTLLPTATNFTGNSIHLTVSSAILNIYCNGVKQTDLARSVALSYDIGITPTATFSATQFIGNVRFENVLLKTSSIYVFDFELIPTITQTIVESHGFTPDFPGQTAELYYFGSTLRTYVLANRVVETVPEQLEGATIQITPTPPTLSAPSITGNA